MIKKRRLKRDLKRDLLLGAFSTLICFGLTCGKAPNGTGSRDSALWTPSFVPGGPGSSFPNDPPPEMVGMTEAAGLFAKCFGLLLNEIVVDSTLTKAIGRAHV